MADEPTESTPTPIEDQLTYGPWEASVDARLGQLRMVVYVEGAVAVAGLAIGILAFKGMANLATTLQQIMQAMGQVVPQPMPSDNGRPVRADPRVDETPYPDSPIANPIEGPKSEASQRVKDAIAADPLSPKDMLRPEDELRLGPLDRVEDN